MKVVILCGGKGTRMGKEDIPKPLYPVGEKPILWHIMRMYAHFGYKEFVLCLGYQGAKIREYFSHNREWDITFADTGVDTRTGGRLCKARKHIPGPSFLATYGDGLADIRLPELLAFHAGHQKTATLTAVKPHSPFGIVGIDAHSSAVTHFEEKPLMDHWINAGFFVFSQEIFDFLTEEDILETDTFSRLVSHKKIAAYKHTGFWECMDTYKDNLRLNQMWHAGHAPWAVWKNA